MVYRRSSVLGLRESYAGPKQGCRGCLSAGVEVSQPGLMLRSPLAVRDVRQNLLDLGEAKGVRLYGFADEAARLENHSNLKICFTFLRNLSSLLCNKTEI